MTVRLNRQPCPDCKEDTLHTNMQCRQCGHINLTPAQHRRKSFVRHMTMVHRRTTADSATIAIRDASAKRAHKATKLYGFCTDAALKGRGLRSSFGSKRERTRI